MKKIIVSVLSSLVILLSACSTTTDPALAYQGETGEQIFQKGETALRNRDYQEAIKRFEALDAQYPFGKNAQTEQLHIIYAYYMNSDYASAESAADRYIHTYPSSPHVDYAYLMRGLANYYQNLGIFEKLFRVDLATRDLSQIKKSYADFATLYHTYPNSPYAPGAHQYMLYLRNTLAAHELEVAQYYFSRAAYVAAANRASMVVRHYQGSPSVPDALRIMVKSYNHLNLTQNANEAEQVLKYNGY